MPIWSIGPYKVGDPNEVSR